MYVDPSVNPDEWQEHEPAASDVTEDVSLSSRSDEAELHHKALVERLAEAIVTAYVKAIDECSRGRLQNCRQLHEHTIARAVLPILADLLAERDAERDALRALFVDGALHEHVDGHWFYKIRKDAVPDVSEERSDG